MHLIIDIERSTTTLSHPGEIGTFDVTINGSDHADAVLLAGIPRFEQRVWVPVETLRRLAGTVPESEWQQTLACLVQHARSCDRFDERLQAVCGDVVGSRVPVGA